MKILIAVDGSKNSLDAVDCLVQHADWYREKPQVQLVNVRPPVPQLPNLRRVVSRAQLQRYYEDEGQAALGAACKRLQAAGVDFQARVLVGPIAETIAAHAKKSGCDMVYVGTRGMTATANALLGSTATKLLHICPVPVLLVR